MSSLLHWPFFQCKQTPTGCLKTHRSWLSQNPVLLNFWQTILLCSKWQLVPKRHLPLSLWIHFIWEWSDPWLPSKETFLLTLAWGWPCPQVSIKSSTCLSNLPDLASSDALLLLALFSFSCSSLLAIANLFASSLAFLDSMFLFFRRLVSLEHLSLSASEVSVLSLLWASERSLASLLLSIGNY